MVYLRWRGATYRADHELVIGFCVREQTDMWGNTGLVPALMLRDGTRVEFDWPAAQQYGLEKVTW